MNQISMSLNLEREFLNNALQPSSSPTDEEKELCQQLSEFFHEDKELLQSIGAIKLNFDLKLKRESLVIKGVYVIKENGQPVYLELMKTYTYNSRPTRNILSTTLRKAGALFMIKDASNLNHTELKIAKLNLFVTALMIVCALFSGVSLLWLKYIPSPIDKALFWSSTAGALGLLIDNWKRKFLDGGNK